MECSSDIDGYEIYDLNSTCAIEKERKDRHNQEEDSVMNDTWRSGVLIEKAGNPKILRFKIQKNWTPPPLKSGEKKFDEIDNPGKWYRFFYHK